MGKAVRGTWRNLVKKSGGITPLGRYRSLWENGTNVDL
jgi:hypothetical protein